jgi:hypothetical protein
MNAASVMAPAYLSAFGTLPIRGSEAGRSTFIRLRYGTPCASNRAVRVTRHDQGRHSKWHHARLRPRRHPCHPPSCCEGLCRRIHLHRSPLHSPEERAPAPCSLCLKPSNVIGFRRTVAVFIAIEVKAAGGRSSPEQHAFIQVVQQAGGLAAIARSVDEAEAILGRPA